VCRTGDARWGLRLCVCRIPTAKKKTATGNPPGLIANPNGDTSRAGPALPGQSAFLVPCPHTNYRTYAVPYTHTLSQSFPVGARLISQFHSRQADEPT